MKNLIIKFQRSFKNNKNNFSHHWTYFAVIIASLIFFYPVIFQNKIPLPVDALVGAHVPWTETKWVKYPAGIPIKNQEITDAFSQFYPWRELIGEYWRAGKAPLWNPYMFSGTPFLATLHSAALYPLNIFYTLLGSENAWSLLIFSQVLLSGVFMVLLLKELKLGNSASFLGAIAFMFSGYMIAWLEFATGGQAGLWLPLLLYMQIRYEKTKNTNWLFIVPFIFFFIYTAGDFQVPFYITVSYVLFSIYIGVKGKRFWKTQLNFFLALFIGILLSSVQLLPTIELFLRSIRYDDPYNQNFFYGLMNWEKITNFIWPDFYGNVVTGNYWGKYDYHEFMGFIGVIGLSMAIFAMVCKKLDKYENFFLAMFVISILFLFPTPLAYLPYKYKIPGLGTSFSSRLLFITNFNLSVLTAYGFSKIKKDSIYKYKQIVFYLITASLGVIAGITILLTIYNGLPDDLLINLKVALKNTIPSTLVLLIIFGSIVFTRMFLKKWKLSFLMLTILLCFLSFAELIRFAWKNTPLSPRKFVFPSTEITDFLGKNLGEYRISGGIPLNLFMPYKFKSAEGYDPIYPTQNSEWFSLVNSGSFSALSGRFGKIHNFASDLINYASVKYVIDYRKNIHDGISENGTYYDGVSGSIYEEVFREGRISVFENKDTLPYVWMSNNLKTYDDNEELMNKLIEGKISKEKLILVDNDVKVTDDNGKLVYKINDFDRNFNEITFNIMSDKDGYLFISESYDPGWVAYVDDVETEILKANYLFQTMPILAGEHSIRLIYKPLSFVIGKYLSYFALGTIILGLIITNRKRNLKG